MYLLSIEQVEQSVGIVVFVEDDVQTGYPNFACGTLDGIPNLRGLCSRINYEVPRPTAIRGLRNDRYLLELAFRQRKNVERHVFCRFIAGVVSLLQGNGEMTKVIFVSEKRT